MTKTRRGAGAAALPSKAVLIPVLAMSLMASACRESAPLTLPTVEQIEEHYEGVEGLQEAEVNGNVAVIVVLQSSDQLRRGGAIWARVGPYIYLFSDETRKLFEDFDGLAAVRVITRTSSGTTVANALLTRDELNDLLWRRSLNIAGRARRDGTERVTLLEDLIEWGEDHTEFEYNARYVPR